MGVPVQKYLTVSRVSFIDHLIKSIIKSALLYLVINKIESFHFVLFMSKMVFSMLKLKNFSRESLQDPSILEKPPENHSTSPPPNSPSLMHQGSCNSSYAPAHNLLMIIL